MARRRKTQVTQKSAKPPGGGARAALPDARGREGAWDPGGARIWSEEMRRHFDELAAQGAAVLEDLARCQTPYDVLKVEQAWLMARSKSYFDSGLRFAGIFADATRALAAPPRAPAHRGDVHRRDVHRGDVHRGDVHKGDAQEGDAQEDDALGDIRLGAVAPDDVTPRGQAAGDGKTPNARTRAVKAQAVRTRRARTPRDD
jgi:hypothetical protein